MTFASKLRELRTRAGLTHAELADRTAINLVALYAYEAGRSAPALHGLQRLATALSVSLEEFRHCDTPRDARSKRHRLQLATEARR